MESTTGKSSIPSISGPSSIAGIHEGSEKLGQTKLAGPSRGKAKVGELSGPPPSDFLGPNPNHAPQDQMGSPKAQEKREAAPKIRSSMRPTTFSNPFRTI